MEDIHRKKITRNHVKLSETVDLDQLYPSLLSKGIIFQNDLDRLKAKYKVREEQAQEFFLRYTRRGPRAFQILIDSLVETGHISEARLLQDDLSCSLTTSGGYRRNCGSAGSSSSSNGSGVEPFSGSVSPYNSSSPSESPKPIRHNVETTFDELPPLVLNIQPATLYNMGVDKDECYEMMSRPRGFALIINNLEFIGDPEATRHGAEHDTEHLRIVLEQLHFELMIRHNVKKDELLENGGIIDKFLSLFERTDVDCCIVAVMSHGTDGYFLTSDPVNLYKSEANRVSLHDEFLPKFNNRFTPLQNKPKIFIVQACRGDYRDIGVRRTLVDSKDPDRSDSGSETSSPSHSSSSSNYLRRMPLFEDFLICQSTVPGFVANRDTQRGTWYIYSLTQELAEKAHNTEFTKILRGVGRRMRRLSSEYGEKQMSSFTNTGFHRDLYFNPGLFST